MTSSVCVYGVSMDRERRDNNDVSAKTSDRLSLAPPKSHCSCKQKWRQTSKMPTCSNVTSTCSYVASTCSYVASTCSYVASSWSDVASTCAHATSTCSNLASTSYLDTAFCYDVVCLCFNDNRQLTNEITDELTNELTDKLTDKSTNELMDKLTDKSTNELTVKLPTLNVGEFHRLSHLSTAKVLLKANRTHVSTGICDIVWRTRRRFGRCFQQVLTLVTIPLMCALFLAGNVR